MSNVSVKLFSTKFNRRNETSETFDMMYELK